MPFSRNQIIFYALSMKRITAQDEIGVKLTTSGGKWWENNGDMSLNYINRLEDIIEGQERHISKLTTDPRYLSCKSEVVIEFLRASKAILMPDEFVFLCLKLAGFKYAVIQDIVCSLSKSDSTIHRKVQLAKTKLLNHFSICEDDQVQS